ncbi:MAG: bifunctional folylpolyglutamate synthase/dihydrofolate synthase [Ruminococcus sp.]|nr:bifunctional folylpolyglutamate synthase/dihydrofolate synthase [Ruminococcus sp.]
MDYKQLISRYTKLGQRVSDLSRIESLMKAVGDPQNKLRFIHIAGTNGKGRVTEMLARTLTAAGFKTGSFTSPYILRYNDRIRIDGTEITDAQLDELADIVDEAVGGLAAGFSQFEITQAMALLHYQRQGCDIVVFETGLGGLLDSTNVIPPPEAAVITSIALDHTAILGGTVEEIARHKAGIIKKGSAAVCSACVEGKALAVIEKQAAACGTKLIVPDMSRMTVHSCGIFGSEFDFGGLSGLRLRMGGRHQLYNAAAVIETVGALRGRGYDIPEKALREGLAAQIPARVQILRETPPVILDGSHNPEGISALAAVVGELPRPRRAVIGMLSDKDSRDAARLIADSFDEFICVDGFMPNARPAEELAELLYECGAAARASDLPAAETVRQLAANADGPLVICGSLYLASEILGSDIFGKGEV